MTVRESGRDAVMINCNPETVSTDYDTSDRLYFEPLTLEDVLGVVAGRAARGRGRAVRRADPAEARRRAGRGGRAAAGHERRGDRPGGGPRAVRRAAGRAGLLRAAVRDGALGGGGPGAGRRGRLSAARAPVLRAGGQGDGDRLLARRSRRLSQPRASPGRGRRRRAAGHVVEAVHLPGPLPGERHRGRRRRAVRRHGGVDRRDHAARRGGRGPLRRQRVRAAAALARRGDARADPLRHARARACDRRRRAAERAVRGARRRAVRDRGQPARVAHGAVRVQGGRRAAGQARVPDHAGRADR